LFSLKPLQVYCCSAITEFLQFSSLSVVRTVDIRRPDGQLCERLSKISLKFFPDFSRVWTVLPCHPDGRTSATCNFHIKALRVWTKGMVVRTVDLMHVISIYVAPASEPLRLASGRRNFECATCLMEERAQTGIHIVRKVAAIFPYLYFGKKSHSWSNTECRSDVLLKRLDLCKLEQFEAS
jgi:hypothetical protein